MKNLFLAKSSPQQTISEHTEDLLKQISQLNSLYPNIPGLDWDLLYMACYFHDFGKINTKFQNKIMRAIDPHCSLLKDSLPHVQEVPHGYLSCAFLPLAKLPDEESRKVVVQAIYFHHHRQEPEPVIIDKVIRQDLSQYYQAFADELTTHIKQNGYKTFEIEPPALRYHKYIKSRLYVKIRKGTTKKYIMVKGLLNKIDHAASAGIPVEISGSGLQPKLKSYFKHVLRSEPNELQKYMLAHQNDNNVIVASTGIGKTEGALFWLGSSKGFFSLPLRVSINAIYKRIHNKTDDNRKKGIDFPSVGLLHADTASEYVKANIYSGEYYEETRQWSMPLTVCTLDQLLDFVFKQEGYEQKLAVLAYSKLIVDEVQMYSAKMLACLLIALKSITEMGGRFTIMTATFAPFVGNLMHKLQISFIQPPRPFIKTKHGRPMLRHRVKIMDCPILVDDILANQTDGKILVIVNTVRAAQDIYERLKSEEDKNNLNGRKVYLFHGRFTKSNRSAIENQILQMGELSDPSRCIWVTTQIVEASVDIDFDVLYTELSDLNGLFQRMGRVFRNRELTDERVNVYVYTGGEKNPSGVSAIKNRSVIDQGIFDLSKETLLTLANENPGPILFSEEMKMDLIARTYTTVKLKETSYYRDIRSYLRLLEDIVEYEELDDKIIDLREIFNIAVIPYDVYEDNKEKIAKWIDEYQETFHLDKNNNSKAERTKAKEERIKIRDQIRGLTVDIPRYRYKHARKINRYVKMLRLGKYYEWPIVDYQYNSKLGLTFTNEPGSFRPDDQFL
jgi:CRISPR-associated endonuclease/helicase Cas3